MLTSTESDSEADKADDRILESLTALEPELKAAWDKDPERYNAALTATVRRARNVVGSTKD